RHQFKNAHGKTIIVDLMTQSGVDSKTLTATAAGNPPDVAGLWSSNMASFANFGALTPLDDFCRASNTSRKDYIPVYWDICQYEGHTYALPSAPATVALYYNKGLFKAMATQLRAAGLNPDRPPATLGELDRYNAVLTVRDPATGRYTQVGFMPTEPGWWTWAWGQWFGGHLIDKDGNITATDPGNIAALEWAQTIARTYNSTDLDKFHDGFGQFDSPRNAFIEGKVAMVIQGVWMVNFIKRYNPTMDFAAAPFPAAVDTGGDPITNAECDTLSIPRDAVHPDEAYFFIHWVNTPEGMEILCTGQGKHSPLAAQTPQFTEHHPNRYWKLFTDLARSKNAFSTPATPIWNEYSREISRAFSKIWHGLNDPQGNPYTARSALQEVQDLMEKRLANVRAHSHSETKAAKSAGAAAPSAPTAGAAP
ncbi:MAG TPA: extracellular solute-binding protein, partial [Planctomycetota bacterium]|nr:extracellular solute-binding protein [Planctomycetota bacterium]